MSQPPSAGASASGAPKPSELNGYILGVELGRGTFGSVYKAQHKETGDLVAIKKLKIAKLKEGVDPTALREIKLLKELHHENVIRMRDAFPNKSNIILVFDLMVSDLEAIIKDANAVLSEAVIKTYMQQLLRALAACHEAWVLHRDIKPNNCLIAQDGSLKLGDFGLARVFGSPHAHYTPQVFATWYRPPELFFGALQYTSSVDIWAAGCIFAELMLRRPWFPGVSDIDQLAKIFAVLGTPDEHDWPGVKELPHYLQFTETRAVPLSSVFPTVSDLALDLLSRMVAMDPSKRITAREALAHPYFTSAPLPVPNEQLPKPVSREQAPLKGGPEARLDLAGARSPAGGSEPAAKRRPGILPAAAAAAAAAGVVASTRAGAQSPSPRSA